MQAHIARAALLVIATADTVDARKMVDIARTLNPSIGVVLRSHNEDEAGLWAREGLGTVFLGESELAKGMTAHVVAQMKPAR